MSGFGISLGFITGVSIGIEFPEPKLMVVDLLIVRLFFEWFSEEDV